MDIQLFGEPLSLPDVRPGQLIIGFDRNGLVAYYLKIAARGQEMPYVRLPVPERPAVPIVSEGPFNGPVWALRNAIIRASLNVHDCRHAPIDGLAPGHILIWDQGEPLLIFDRGIEGVGYLNLREGTVLIGLDIHRRIAFRSWDIAVERGQQDIVIVNSYTAQ